MLAWRSSRIAHLHHVSWWAGLFRVLRSARMMETQIPIRTLRTHCSKRPVCFDHVRRPCGQATALAANASSVVDAKSGHDPSSRCQRSVIVGQGPTRSSVFSQRMSCWGVIATIKPPGGARRDRTDDLMLAKHALSQLSYGPTRRRRVMRT